MIQENNKDTQQTPERVSPQVEGSVEKNVAPRFLWKGDREHIAIVVIITGILCLVLAIITPLFAYPNMSSSAPYTYDTASDFLTNPFELWCVAVPLVSLVGLGVGLYYRKAILLCAITAIWWAGSFFSVYRIWYASQPGRGELAGLGIVFFTYPYVVFFILMVGIELFFIRKWRGLDATLLKWEAGLLAVWLIVQAFWAFA